MSGKARKYQQEGAEESSDDDEEAPEDEEAEEDEEGEEDEEESSKGLLAPVARRPRHTPERVKLCLVTVFCALPVLTSGYAAHLLSRLESEEQTFESFRHRERLALKATRLAELFSADRVQHAAALAEVAPDGRSAWNTSVLSLLDDIAGSVDASYNATPDAAVASDVKRSIDAVDQSVREWLRATVIDVELLQQLAAFNGSLRAAPAAGVHRQAFGEVFKALDGISLDLIPADAYPPSVDVLALRADLAQMHLAVHQVRAAFFAYIRTGDYQHAESLEGYMRTAIALADQLDSATSAGGGNTSTPELAAGVTVLAQLSGNLSEARGGLAGWWQKTAALSLAARAAAGNASSNTGVDDFPSLVLALRRQNRSQRALSLGGSVASQIRALEDAVQGVPADAEGSFARGVLVCVFVGLAVLLFVHGLASCYADVERRAADPATRACGVAGFAAKKRLHGYFAAGYCLLVVDVVAAYLASESYLGTLDASHAMAVGRSRCGAGLGSALTEVNEILLLRSHLVLLDQGTYADVEQSYQHLLGTLLAVDGEAEAFPFAEWQRFRQTIGMVAAPLAAWYDRFSADYRSLEAARGFAGDGSLVTTPDFEAAVSAAVSAPNGSEWASLPEDLHEAYATYLDHRIYAPLRVRQYTCQEVDPERRQAQALSPWDVQCSESTAEFESCAAITNQTMCEWNKMCAWAATTGANGSSAGGVCVNSLAPLELEVLRCCAAEARVASAAAAYLVTGDAADSDAFAAARVVLAATDEFHTKTGQSVPFELRALFNKSWGLQTQPLIEHLRTVYERNAEYLEKTWFPQAEILMQMRDAIHDPTRFSLSSAPLAADDASFTEVVKLVREGLEIVHQVQESEYEVTDHALFRRRNTVAWVSIAFAWSFLVVLYAVVRELSLFVTML